MAEENKQNKGGRMKAFSKKIRFPTAREIVQGTERFFKRVKTVVQKSRTTFYRLVVLNSETLEQVGTYRLSLMNLYVLLSSLVVGFTILILSLIIFTPIKRFIPGYGGMSSERSVFELAERVQQLEQQVKDNQAYADNFKKLLTADVQYEKDIPKDKITAATDSNFNLAPGEAEMQIRAGGNSPFDGDDMASSDGAKALKILNRNDPLESMFLTTPLSGQVSAAFSLAKKHYGTDIVAPKNTPIRAVADGFVVSSDWTLETGNTIAIQHANNVVSFYKHNSSLLKKTGEKVKSGEAIAIIGNTGEQTTGPHLHFELWQNGKPLNPQEYLRF